MKIVVTGAAGKVGRYVLAELAARHDVTAFDLRPPADRAIPFRSGDATRLDDCLTALAGAETVIHLAAIPNPLHDPPERVMQVNTMGTFNVLEAAARAGVRRVVLAATDSALGFVFRRTDFDPVYLPIDEQHPLEPQDAYGLSKLASEEICQAYHRAYGIETVRVRICRVIFPDETDLNASLLADPSTMAKGLWVWIDARDAARAFRLAAETPGLANEAVFAVAPDVYARPTTAELIARFYPGWSLWADKLPGRTSFISGARARDLLGFVPAHGIDD